MQQHRVFSYIDRGFYDEQIKRIWRYFPRTQTLFIKHEKLKRHPQITMKAIANFLEKGRYENYLRKLRKTLYSNSLHYARAIAEYFPEKTKIHRMSIAQNAASVNL